MWIGSVIPHIDSSENPHPLVLDIEKTLKLGAITKQPCLGCLAQAKHDKPHREDCQSSFLGNSGPLWTCRPVAVTY